MVIYEEDLTELDKLERELNRLLGIADKILNQPNGFEAQTNRWSNGIDACAQIGKKHNKTNVRKLKMGYSIS